MNKANFVLMLMLWLAPSFLIAQEAVTIQLGGISPSVCKQMNSNNDRVSWFYIPGSDKLGFNLQVELTNTGVRNGDRGRFGIQANPDIEGNYRFNDKVDVRLRRLDKNKPITIRIELETSLGNEVFAIVERTFDKVSEPIILDRYMWRATNNKINPERKLCLAFSSFIENKGLNKKVTDNEGFIKFSINDVQVFLKQGEKEEWKKINESLSGVTTNGTSVRLNNKMPDWINPSKKLWVRFSVMTPKGNFIWGEYEVEPNEYRKEFRATNYSGAAFDLNATIK